MIESEVTSFSARWPTTLQWHLKQRLESLFAADGSPKDRPWTVRNVIERLLAAVRREKIAMGTVEFEKTHHA